MRKDNPNVRTTGTNTKCKQINLTLQLLKPHDQLPGKHMLNWNTMIPMGDTTELFVLLCPPWL